jgi:hypothetical protein
VIRITTIKIVINVMLLLIIAERLASRQHSSLAFCRFLSNIDLDIGHSKGFSNFPQPSQENSGMIPPLDLKYPSESFSINYSSIMPSNAA